MLFERIAATRTLSSMDNRVHPPHGRIHPYEYGYLTEFQSHEPEFDYLKSLEIEEKINKVRWCHGQSAGKMLVSGGGCDGAQVLRCGAGAARAGMEAPLRHAARLPVPTDFDQRQDGQALEGV